MARRKYIGKREMVKLLAELNCLREEMVFLNTKDEDGIEYFYYDEEDYGIMIVRRINWIEEITGRGFYYP